VGERELDSCGLGQGLVTLMNGPNILAPSTAAKYLTSLEVVTFSRRYLPRKASCPCVYSYSIY
jgi:hypothetical protein